MTNGVESLEIVYNHWYTEEVSYEDEKIVNDNLAIVEKEVKALKIIKEKGLPLVEKDMIKQSINYNEYNAKYSWRYMKNASIQKTKEEFELLKEVVK